jgi:hypothetical protein
MNDQVNKSPFLQEVVRQIRGRHYNRCTEGAYLRDDGVFQLTIHA